MDFEYFMTGVCINLLAILFFRMAREIEGKVFGRIMYFGVFCYALYVVEFDVTIVRMLVEEAKKYIL
jgi:hypothetical protein